MATFCGLNKFACTKFFLYIYSIFFGLCSLIILLMAVIMLAQLRIHHKAIASLKISNIIDLEIYLISFIIIGCLMIIVACCAFGVSLFFFQDTRFRARVVNKINYVIFVFAVLLLVILISLMAIAIYGLVALPKTDIKSRKFRESFINYNIRMEDKGFVDVTQIKFMCCGIYSSDDYHSILHIPIPPSCCVRSGGICFSNMTYSNGCLRKVDHYYKVVLYNISSVLTVTGLSITPVVVIALVYAVILIISVRFSQKLRSEIHKSLQEASSSGNQ